MEENNIDQLNTEKKPNLKPIFTKSIFMILILIIIIILAFSVIKFIPLVFSSFASVGSLVKSPFDKGLVLEANETDLNSNEIFRLTFNYQPEVEGYYSLSYECAPNLAIAVLNDENPLQCNREYTIAPNEEFIDLETILTKENFYTETEINVTYFDRNKKAVDSDSITISVKDEASIPVSDLSGSATISSQRNSTGSTGGNTGNTTTTTTNETESTSNRQTYNKYWYLDSSTNGSSLPDLRISNTRSISDTVVTFDVSNIGGQSTGNWYFNYVIPGESLETSPLQMSLNPGESVRLTMRFDDIGSGNTIINLDPRNLIRESSESNNNASIYLRGDGGSSYSYNYYDYDDDDYYRYDDDDDADLVVRNLEVGRMSGSRFIEDDEIDEDDDAAVRFKVVNVGGERTGSWRFEIENTPYDDDDDYRSSRQSSLSPGESETFTIEFNNPDEGRYKIKVIVDSDDDVDEENERNNSDSETLEVEED